MPVDTSDFDAFADDLDQAAEQLPPRVRATTQVACRKTRDEARRLIREQMASGGATAIPGYPSTITYETAISGSTVTGEVGPELGRQGSLGHLIEHGGPRSGPNPHLRPAADAEGEVWVDWLGKILDELTR